jgi:cell division protein FtsQ
MSVNWKKYIIVVCDIVIASYLLLAVTAFNKPDDKATHCSEVKINIKESRVDGFLNAGEVKKILSKDKIYPLSMPMASVNPRLIEESLGKSAFVENAECYKTINGHVCINIEQRIPVIRVMAGDGNSYYVDTHGNLMPESRYVTDLIIATGTISKKYAQTVLTRVANHIMADNFWKNQIVQINILDNGTMELVPRVGDHIVYLGTPSHVDKKLERLRKFYLYGLNKAGWNKYNYINLEFDNQIICKRNKRKK